MKYYSSAPKITVLLVILALAFSACGSNEPPELQQAAWVIQHMMAPANLSRSAFCVGFPEGRPSQYVSYLFSDMGAAEWPINEDWADEFDRETARATRTPLAPSGVFFAPNQWECGEGTQLVIRYDDARGVVILEGYGLTDTEPVLHREITLRHVKPAPGVAMFYQSSAQMGLDIQSFDACVPNQ